MSVFDTQDWTHQVPAAWCEMIKGFTWNHYAHLTFRAATSGYSARRQFDRYVRFLERCVQGPVDWALSVERTHAAHHHVHALLKGTCGRVGFLEDKWTHGYSRVTVYRPNGGAEEYLTKALTPDTWHIDISGRLRVGE